MGIVSGNIGLYTAYGVVFVAGSRRKINCTKHDNLECKPMSNPMVALPNVAGALCSTPQSLADAHY